jgi:hypothetical protein
LAESAGIVANAQAGLPGSIGSVNVTVDLGGLTVSGETSDMLNGIAQAAMTGTLDALARGASLTQPRIDPNVAAGR